MLTAILIVEIKENLKFIDKDFLETLLGSFLGGLTVAFTVFLFQLRMEQTRYLSELSNQIDNIFAFQGVWKKNKKGEWLSCEFRQAVGLSNSTSTNPMKVQIRDGEDAPEGVNWNGVLYQIDENFIISSKAMHDYSNWFQLVSTGYSSNLLTKAHVKVLWRSLADSLTGGKDYGMRSWTWHFVCGSDPRFEDSNIANFKAIEKIINSLPSARDYIEKRTTYLKDILNK